MRSAYRVVALLIALAVVVQAAAIAFVTFGVINDVETGTVVDTDYEPNVGALVHGMNGMYVVPLLVLVLLGLSFGAKVHRGRTFALLLLLAVVVQVVLAFVAFGAPLVGWLHGLNAFVVMGLAGSAARSASTPSLRAPVGEQRRAAAV